VLALVAASLTAGCTDVLGGGNDIQDSDGDGVIDSEDYAPHDPDVQEKSDVQNNSSPTQTEGGGNQQVRQDILDTYNSAIGKTNRGTSLLNSSISAFNNDNFSKASSDGSDAHSKFETAETRFSEAYDLALQTDNNEAQTICEEGQQYAVYLQDAGLQASRAAEDAKNGRMSAANDHIDKHQSATQDAEALAVRDPAVLKDVLGL
jgi:hypothetical protein